MEHTTLTLSIMFGAFAVCRLPAQEPIPSWAVNGSFFSMTRTADELSVVCEDHLVPPGVPCERPWRALAIEGPLPFALTGILLAVAAPLADAGVSIFAVSTYDTDYVLVRDEQFEQAHTALIAHGHTIKNA